MSEPVRYEVFITGTAAAHLRRIGKKRGRGALEQLHALIGDLTEDPESKTQALRGALSGFRSLHGGRFHVIIRISGRAVRVYVVAVGWHESGSRDDVYAALERAVRRGGIAPD